MSGTGGLRLDIWLWRARFFKTRTLSAKCIKRGQVRIIRNKQIFRVRKPHSEIQIGDQLTFTAYEKLVQIEVLSLGERRGPAKEAQKLYTLIPSATSGQITD